MSRVTRDYPRQRDEEYDTPPWVAVPIATWLAKQGVRRIWEPAPGRGQLARALVACGFSVAETDSDFLRLHQTHAYDAIVTNPPFGKRGELAEAFIRHAVLELKAPIAAFLLRVDFDSAKTRRDLFGECPSFFGKIVLLDRIVWFERKGAKPSENHAWFIWDRFGRNDGGDPCILYGKADTRAMMAHDPADASLHARGAHRFADGGPQGAQERAAGRQSGARQPAAHSGGDGGGPEHSRR